MRFKLLVFLFAGLALCSLGNPALADEGRPPDPTLQPIAEMDSTHHAFEKVLEGQKVEQTFTIRNKGDGELVIERINTGWGCTASSFTREIPAGGEGKISLVLSTDGYGGRTINQNITVFTNDPDNRRIVLTVAGQVEAFASMIPRFVRLAASVEDFRADQVVVITPSEDHPFSIVATRQVPMGDNASFSHSLEKDEQNGKTVYRLVVENRQRHAGSYYGTIYLSTDHPRRKELSINVHGYIAAPSPQGASAP